MSNPTEQALRDRLLLRDQRRAALGLNLTQETTTATLTFRYPLGAKVRYAVPAQLGLPEAWRIVGRTLTQMEGMHEVRQYTLMPWTLTGQWALDRPYPGVFEADLAWWKLSGAQS